MVQTGDHPFWTLQFNRVKEENKKAPRVIQNPQSLHFGSFWKTHFINPPNVKGQVITLLDQRRDVDGAKLSKPLISVNNKLTEQINGGVRATFKNCLSLQVGLFLPSPLLYQFSCPIQVYPGQINS